MEKSRRHPHTAARKKFDASVKLQAHQLAAGDEQDSRKDHPKKTTRALRRTASHPRRAVCLPIRTLHRVASTPLSGVRNGRFQQKPSHRCDFPGRRESFRQSLARWTLNQASRRRIPCSDGQTGQILPTAHTGEYSRN